MSNTSRRKHRWPLVALFLALALVAACGTSPAGTTPYPTSSHSRPLRLPSGRPLTQLPSQPRSLRRPTSR